MHSRKTFYRKEGYKPISMDQALLDLHRTDGEYML